MARPAVTKAGLAVARGDEPADLVLRGGDVLSPHTREWIRADLAVKDGAIVAWDTRDAVTTVDVAGCALTPGFIDAHMHLESSKLWVDEFARAVVPRGTTAVAADPHEVANVFGLEGVLAVAAAAHDLPLTFAVCASSCVPASPFESAGATMGADEIRTLLEKGAIGVAEVMNFPGAIAGDDSVREKVASAGWRRVDGHAPGLRGAGLDAYLGAGIESDHECTTLPEAVEKRRKGMWVFVREGSASRNLLALLPTIRDHGPARVAWCTDDREPDLLLDRGHVNDCVRMAVAAGLDEITAITLATVNPAEYHNLHHLGSLGPGYQADVLCFDALGSFEPSIVVQAGRVVARSGTMVPETVPASPAPRWMHESVHIDPSIAPDAFALALPHAGTVRAIGVNPGLLTTTEVLVDLPASTSDLARIAVLERHRSTGRVGVGLVQGFGLARGAIASTVAHDAHNVLVVGGRDDASGADMAVAVRRLAELGGGQVAVLDGHVLADVPLPIGGLMSDQPGATVARQLEHLVERARAMLGITLDAPFMHLSFLALSVIPDLRITDRGVLDVRSFALTPVIVTAGAAPG